MSSRVLEGRKARFQEKKNKTTEDFDNLVKIEEDMSRLRKYSSRIKTIPEGLKTLELSGSGIRFQPKRNVYKRGSSIFYYNNPRNLFDRLHLLGGSIIAGNNSAKNEFSEVAHTRHKLGAFSSEDLNSLLSKFLEI